MVIGGSEDTNGMLGGILREMTHITPNAGNGPLEQKENQNSIRRAILDVSSVS